MFKKLQQKWKVGGIQLILILCTFAVTGSLTAFISERITTWVGFDENTLFAWKILLRLCILIFGYQFIILAVSFFFGQFSFFWNYEKKILTKMGFIKGKAPKTAPFKLAIFASGKGSNAEKIIQYFDNEQLVKISLVVCNNPQAGVLDIANQHNIKTLIIDKKTFNQTEQYVELLKNEGITHIILAGFLWKVPETMINGYRNMILNIHPALLPNFGGKGMYGDKVHEAVIASGQKETGITIHLVDEHYDHGKTVFQATTLVEEYDTQTSIAEKVHALEHLHYPRVIAEWLGIEKK
jgi:formyltetrahydrofolate-dependent phosphoribosylglycinamide formyltransferase